MDDLHYPNMSQCGIIIEENLDHVGMDPPDTKIPSELTQILNQPLPDMYDFYIGKESLFMIIPHNMTIRRFKINNSYLLNIFSLHDFCLFYPLGVRTYE